MVLPTEHKCQKRLSRNGISENINHRIYDQVRKSLRGYVCLIIYVLLHTRSLIHDRHDDIAKLLQVPAMPFDIMFPEKATEMKRMLLDYIKLLRRDHFGDTAGADNDINKNQVVQIDDSGFPKAPDPETLANIKSSELQGLYRLYITRQYRKKMNFYQRSPTNFHYINRVSLWR
jgi:hypothetical protein